MANPLITNYDTSKLLIGDNQFIDVVVTASGADIVLKRGEVVGQIAATLLGTPVTAAAGDGSQFPLGLVIEEITVADGSSETITLVNKGRVSESLVNFAGADTLNTLVGAAGIQQTYRALLEGLGLTVKASVENSAVDNQ